MTVYHEDEKNVEFEISNDCLNKIVEIASNNGVYYECFEGSLQDNFVVYNTENIIALGKETRKYIIVKEKPLNEWSSELVAVLTDSIEEVEEFIRGLEA